MFNPIKLFSVSDEFVTEIDFFYILIFLSEDKLSAAKTRVSFFNDKNIGS